MALRDARDSGGVVAAAGGSRGVVGSRGTRDELAEHLAETVASAETVGHGGDHGWDGL